MRAGVPPLPRVDDVLHRAGGDTMELTAFEAAVSRLPREALRAAIAELPANGAGRSPEAYCPRCTMGYRASVLTCAQCTGVPLVTA